jgi:tRNA wybutosine-synthesizing protein 2
MFSRGNISEKARLLALPSVRRAAATAPAGCAAVDLYVGVGYFAFSYLAAGVREVLGWDLNPWSVEGCRRGAERNRWAVEVFGRSRGEGEEDLVDRDVAAYLARVRGEDDDGATPARLLVFNEDNARAPQRVALLRRARRDSATPLPPVRHVNCGMLPSSRAALRLAAEVLDRGWTCWVHVHENFLVEEVAVKAEETRRELEEIVGELWGCGEGGKPTTVEVEYVNRLKSYAPGVVHCVIDLVVGPGLGE